MISPSTAREKFAAYAERRVRDLLGGVFAGYGFPLHPPTGKQAFADEAAAREFVRSWQERPFVTWEVRDWTRAGMGHEEVPVRVDVATLEELIDAAELHSWWRVIYARAELVVAAGGSVETMLATYPWWKSLPIPDLNLVERLVDWLVDHPDSGLLPRAIPVEGVHSKWLESHEPLVKALVAARRGLDGVDSLGLSAKPQRARIRLGPDLAVGGLSDVELRLDQLHLVGEPDVVVVLENEQTFLSLPDRPGVAYLMGSGYLAISTLRHDMFTAPRSPRLIYWGDLDTDGYAILDGLRSAHPGLESLLMDEQTVRQWLHFGVADRDFTPREYPRLTVEETAGLELLLTAGHLRIEQERIPVSAAVVALDRRLLDGG